MTLSRRKFITIAGAAVTSTGMARAASAPVKLGHGDFRYELVPGWGVLGEETPVDHCHGIVCDAEGNIILLTNEIKNNFIVYDASGKLLHKWGKDYPGAHGLSLVREGEKEVLYFTDLDLNKVFKATPSGEILNEWEYPKGTEKYDKAGQYKPSWTLHDPVGDFYVLDGYGRDHIVHYGQAGQLKKIFGGKEGGIPHWGPHGGIFDVDAQGKPSLLLAMSDQQNLMRIGLDGAHISKIDLPGGNPRHVEKVGKHYFIPHLADNWPADRESPGFISVLDENMKVVSNIGGTKSVYDDTGKLQKMASQGGVFKHPHDLAVGKDGSLYVAQFKSGKTYPLKLQRV